MDENKIRSIVRDEINNSRYQSGNPVILRHIHDGIDSPRISQSTLISGNSYSVTVTITPGTVAENTIIITGITNPKRVDFYGIGRDNPGGSPSLKGVMTGSAQFGQVSYTLNSAVQSKAPTATDPNTGETTIPNIIQTNSSTGFASATQSIPTIPPTSVTTWTPYVTEDPFSLGKIVIAGIVYIELRIIAFTNTTITIQATVPTNWNLIGTLIIT